ncbi:MAG: hypothetical protein ACOYT4_01610 [Nanoarchaeota archaeon]
MAFENEMKMLSAMSEALRYRKMHPNADHEEIIKYMVKIIRREKNQTGKILMMAAVSKSLDLARQNPDYSDKEIIKIVVNEGFPNPEEN